MLISAPTGSGKTLAAFLSAIDRLVRAGLDGDLKSETSVLYISPLKALANDIRTNLIEPLNEIREQANAEDLTLPEIRPLVRTGDTAAHKRQSMLKKPPHILVTTPESLYILLTSLGGRGMLETVRTVIVDEIHALARDKRGSHLALTLERLEHLAGHPIQRIGLSATQKPIGALANFLVGDQQPVRVVDIGHRRRMKVSVEVPDEELGAVASNETWLEIYQKLAQLVATHRTTLIFVNTRRLAERIAHHLAGILGEEDVAAHHGSLSKEIRLQAEARLKNGDLKVVVATASLELGLDIGHVDLVCQIGSPRSIATSLQRIGRSGHWKGATPKGIFFVTTRDELIECAALVWSIRRGHLDAIRIPEAPLDILIQQVVAEVSSADWDEASLLELIQKAAPYKKLMPEDFQAVLTLLSEGISTKHGRRGAYLHRDRINKLLRGRKGSRLAAITSGGAIPDTADYLVKAEPDDAVVGTLDEDFAIESSKGDIFQLGNSSWQIRRIERGVVRVQDAKGAPPTIPFWRGEAPARTDELSCAVSKLREELVALETIEARTWLEENCGLGRAASEQAVQYVKASAAALGVLPTQECVVAERFFDESGGMQLIIHAPFGQRVNRAWGLALRKRFCRSFNFELQAAATENGLLLSLSDQHSFPLDSVFSFLSSHTVREILVQALLGVPLFGVRWRWNASRALAILRFSGGRKVPPPLLRMRSEDLLAAIFPEQVACQENIQGDIELPDHPLVKETVRDCLEEAMDIDGLVGILKALESGSIKSAAVDTTEPSPFSHEILNSNPYTFLDEAPLEERRARAVQTRRTLPAPLAKEMGELDSDAIRRVRSDAAPHLGTLEELHDALLTHGVLREMELGGALTDLPELVSTGRIRCFTGGHESVTSGEHPKPVRFWLATERAQLVRLAYPWAHFEPDLDLAEAKKSGYLWERDLTLTGEAALEVLLGARLATLGPTTARELSEYFQLPIEAIDRSLRRIEAQGHILRGSFRSGVADLQWCDRRLLARIHRLTLGRLRKEIEPVSSADFMRFLFRWQHIEPGTRLSGTAGLSVVLEQLEGFEAASSAWESHILRNRLQAYQPEFLDELCLSGRFAWGRLHRPTATGSSREVGSPRVTRPTRLSPITFFRRDSAGSLLLLSTHPDTPPKSDGIGLSHSASLVLDQLERWGASFFNELVQGTRQLPLQVEEAIWELVANGLVTADSFENLRYLIDPKRRRATSRFQKRRKHHRFRKAPGRWSLLRRGATPSTESIGSSQSVEDLASLLLRRWGLVCREVARHENWLVSWRDLLQAYRLKEARGEIRGGRFVSGPLGEQFALPEAVEMLRRVRRQKKSGVAVRISASDPLNLSGILLPGNKIRTHPDRSLIFRDGCLDEESELSPSAYSPLETAKASDS